MTHTLYSFRRCPYAMRARLAIAYSKQTVLLREIILKEKPPEMLKLSNKGTVPVLETSNGEVLDESLDIMVWAILKNDPEQWLSGNLSAMLALIDENDFEFKAWLDKYKYAVRFPEHNEEYYREQCEEFLIQLEQRLVASSYLFSDKLSLADIAIFPFVRQFSLVNEEWFQESPYPCLQKWLEKLITSPLFHSIMQKYPTWLESQQEQKFP